MISLSCAIGEYEHFRDLETRRVRPEGIDLNFLHFPVEEIFFRAIRFREFDLSEMSMGRLLAMLSEGDCPFVAIPVFPSRMFRHSAIYVRSEGRVLEPKDLRGARVGIPEWAQTAGIYVRGFLADAYGVSPKDIQWVQGGLQQAGREEEVTIRLPEGIRLRREEGRTLNDMLLAGDLDAIISAHPPEAYKRADPRVRTLFTNVAEAERRYWQETGIFPIMHAIVIRKDIFEGNRWIATNLQAAFSEAKDRSIARAQEITASRYPFPFFGEYIRTTIGQFGSDFWPYGIDANRPTLDAFLRYAFDQGITQRLFQADELFAPEVSLHFKI